MARITTYDIAKACGVSQATVDRAMNNRSNIKKETRDLILSTAAQLNYHKANLPSYYKAGKSKIIGIIVPAALPFFADLLVSVTKAAKIQGYHTMVSFSEFNIELERKCLAEHLKINADGIILFPLGDDGSEIKKIMQMGIPVVTVIRKIKNYNFDFVSINYEQASARATQYLLDLGHKKIGYFTIWDNSSNQYTYNKRLKGIVRTLEANGLSLEQQHVILDTDNCQNVHNLIHNDNMPTAFICFNDINAIRLMSFLNTMNIKVPDDISLISFDNMSMLHYITPGVTSVSYPFDDIAEAAINTLIHRVDGLDSEAIIKLFDTQIVRRESCKRLV